MECATRQALAYDWTIALPVPRGPARKLDPTTMTASELMFFCGAPLAHVIAYEDHLRRGRARQALRGAVRNVLSPRSFGSGGAG